MKKILTIATFSVLLLLILAPEAFSQRNRRRSSGEGTVETFRWRSIGPGNMMGRVSGLDAINTDHKKVLVGAASGGVWLSNNGGNTWTPIFDNYGSASIGDVAFFQPDPSIIWVGTGEANNRNSSAWGDGIYKSTDGGKSFTNMGLKETHQIARVATHPTNKDIVYVAAVGHLWGYSGTRGLFRTTDGGKTWKKLVNGLPDNEKTGGNISGLFVYFPKYRLAKFPRKKTNNAATMDSATQPMPGKKVNTSSAASFSPVFDASHGAR